MVSFCSEGPKGLGGKSIYLTDLARRALSWWLASVQALPRAGTGRIIEQSLLQQSGITHSCMSEGLSSSVPKHLGEQICLLLALPACGDKECV